MNRPLALYVTELTEDSCAATTRWVLPWSAIRHSRTIPIESAVRRDPPSGLNAAEVTAPLCLGSLKSGSEPSRPHTHAVSSLEVVTMYWSSGLNAAEVTGLRAREHAGFWRCSGLTCHTRCGLVRPRSSRGAGYRG